jgi:hypothetical protein
MQARITADILRVLIPRVKKQLPRKIQKLFTADVRYLVNPTGKFVIGGPHGDTGLTGRKIIVDTYGGKGAHGGGAFSGKDPSKVDRSAAYAARYVAKNLVAAGVAKQVLVQLAYAIGVAEPVGFYINTYNTCLVRGADGKKLNDGAIAERVQRTFALPWLRIYTNTDVVGVEIAGAAKNVVALAAGMVDGLGLGSNAKSALLARGLAEIVRLGSALGARPETFFGIAGVGDLATTCFSPEGRNRSCGEAIGSGEPLASYLARTNSVVEGVATSHALLALAQKHGVDMPIVRAVESILFHGKTPAEAIRDLMGREAGAERVG